eukprot:1016310-Prymnesium_polylepis.2
MPQYWTYTVSTSPQGLSPRRVRCSCKAPAKCLPADLRGTVFPDRRRRRKSRPGLSPPRSGPP